MPLEHRFEADRRILWVTVHQALDAQEIEDLIRAMARSAAFPADVDTVWLLDDFEFENAGPGLFENLVARRKKFPGRHSARIALVAASDLGFGMCRMYQITCEAHGAIRAGHITVKRDAAAAAEWLLDQRRAAPCRQAPAAGC